MQKVDIGCGPRKEAGCFGVDHHAYPGVDLVVDLNQTPWPIETGRFDEAVSNHVIEHIPNVAGFLKEIHRICKNDAVVYIETPHFTSIDSYSDPTHLWHYSSRWWSPLQRGEYLASQVGSFEIIDRKVTFSDSFMNWLPRLYIKVFGIDKWEKKYAFRYPARNVGVWLRVKK